MVTLIGAVEDKLSSFSSSITECHAQGLLYNQTADKVWSAFI